MDNKAIGQKLRALRGTLDAKSVADALEISTSALFMYERGERIPEIRSKSALPTTSAKPSKKFFSPNEHILCLNNIFKGGEPHGSLPAHTRRMGTA